MRIKVAIVEDEPETLKGLKSMVESSDDLLCCGTFENAQSFVNKFTHLEVDVVLMDIDLRSSMNGIECVEKLHPYKPEVQFLMCTNLEDTDNIFAALQIGATGYIVKNTTSEKLITAIKDINSGGSPMSPQIARKLIGVVQKDNKNSELLKLLTPKEYEAVVLISKGHLYKEIADIQDVSIETVRPRIRSIYKKLQVHNKTDAVNLLFPKTKI
jgi:NarL family two-component system response regulator LiaR